MKSSSICSAARRTARNGGLGVCALLAVACGVGSAARTAADLTNPFLDLEHSTWLIGPISRLATPQEIKEYLALTDDAKADAFIRHFWEIRNPSPGRPLNPLFQAFEQRGAAADRLYSEAGRAGRRTDRGTLYVLYGRPGKIEFEVAPNPQDPPIEVWQYSEKTPAGLDGKRPLSIYRFAKRGDLTVTYVPNAPSSRRRPGPDPPDGR